MKNQILNYSFCGIFALLLLSCGNSNEKKKDGRIESGGEKISKTLNENQSDFVYSQADKKVKMILENGAKSLIVGKPTKANFPTENINNQLFMISGPGIMVNQDDQDGFHFTITPIEKTLVNGNLEIDVTEYFEREVIFTHKFLVPVKN